MRLPIKQGDWVTKTVTVKDKTKKTLKTGKVVPTWLAMTRNASKV